ncbi:hypothetical protein [Streptomyces cavourensis]
MPLLEILGPHEAFGEFQYPTSPLAPVADLQLRSLLAEPGGDLSGVTGLSQERMTSVFARIARESEGIQDLDERMEVA